MVILAPLVGLLVLMAIGTIFFCLGVFFIFLFNLRYFRKYGYSISQGVREILDSETPVGLMFEGIVITIGLTTLFLVTMLLGSFVLSCI